MKYLIFFTFLIVSISSYGQSGTKPNYTAPDFQGNVIVEDSLGIKNLILFNDGTTINTASKLDSIDLKADLTNASQVITAYSVIVKEIYAKDTIRLDTTKLKIFDDGINLNFNSENPISIISQLQSNNSILFDRNGTNTDILIKGATANTGVNATSFIYDGNFAFLIGSAANISYRNIQPNNDNILDFGNSARHFLTGYISNISSSGTGARSYGIERNTTPGGTGANLNIYAGGCAALAENGGGGMLTLSGGISTDNAFTSVRITRYSRSSTSGTADNTKSDAFIVTSETNLVDSVDKVLFEIPLSTDQISLGTIDFGIVATNGDTASSINGLVKYNCLDVNGTIVTTISETLKLPYNNPVTTSIDITTIWKAIIGTGKVTIYVNSDIKFLNAASHKIRYTINNFGSTNPIQL